MAAPPYRDFYYPLNVFMHILTHEQGRVDHLHYGFFSYEGEPLAAAQERATNMLLERLPPPPARVLDTGSGLGATLSRLAAAEYDAIGITPDEKQVAVIRERYGDVVRVLATRFEDLNGVILSRVDGEGSQGAAPRWRRSLQSFDSILFQESSQYIDSEALFAKAGELTRHVVVADEFATEPLQHEGALRTLDSFLAAADRNEFRLVEDVEVSSMASPTIDYFLARLPRYRDSLISDLGLTSQQVDDLVASGERYKALYAGGTYQYHLMQFRR